MKKGAIVLLAGLLLFGGCKKKEEPLQLMANSLYNNPTNPTTEQIEAFNALVPLIENGSETDLAKQIAVAFSFDFYTFQNKTDENDVGGIMFMPTEKREEAKKYIAFYYYKNFTTITNQYGKESLPQVKAAVAADPVAATFEDGNIKHDAYEVRIALTYATTKIPETALKNDTVVTVAKYDSTWYVVAVK